MEKPKTLHMCSVCRHIRNTAAVEGVLDACIQINCTHFYHSDCRDAWEAWAGEKINLCCRFCYATGPGVDRSTYVCEKCVSDPGMVMKSGGMRDAVWIRDQDVFIGVGVFSGALLVYSDWHKTKVVTRITDGLRRVSTGSQEGLRRIFEGIYASDEMLEAFDELRRLDGAVRALREEVASAFELRTPSIGEMIEWSGLARKLIDDMSCPRYRLDTAYDRAVCAAEECGLSVLGTTVCYSAGYRNHSWIVGHGRCVCPE
jgi:hypothetical protein